MGSVRPPLFGHCGPRTVGGPHPGGPIRLFAGNALDHHRRSVGRRGTGFCCVVQLGAPGRQVARANGQGRNQRSRRLCGAVWRALDLDHCDCGDRACGRECVEGESLGILYDRDDGAYRNFDGYLHALPSGRARHRSVAPRVRPGDGVRRRGTVHQRITPPGPLLHL